MELVVCISSYCFYVYVLKCPFSCIANWSMSETRRTCRYSAGKVWRSLTWPICRVYLHSSFWHAQAICGGCREAVYSDSMVRWMEKNRYDHEATYLRVICNWRRAYDERGLSTVQHSQFNNDFLNYILDDLMSWHKQEGLWDFSLLEVNRYLQYKICILDHSLNVQ